MSKIGSKRQRDDEAPAGEGQVHTVVRLRPKHRKLVAHYLRFTDDKTPATDAEIRAFIIWESRGIAPEDINISRILEGKQRKELTLKMIYEEVFYYWSQGWGWALPLVDIIEDKDEDDIFRSNCQKIFKTLEQRGVEDVLRWHSEFSPEQKERWLAGRRSLHKAI